MKEQVIDTGLGEPLVFGLFE